MKASSAAAQAQQLRGANNLPPGHVHHRGSDNDHQTLLDKALMMVSADKCWRSINVSYHWAILILLSRVSPSLLLVNGSRSNACSGKG